MDPVFLRRVGFHMDYPANADHSHLVAAIESSCVTEREFNADPDSCISRIRGALEESPDFFYEETPTQRTTVVRGKGTVTGRLVSKGPNMQTISKLSPEERDQFRKIRDGIARQLFGKD